MSFVVDLICLANSEKKNERCIAGIDRNTGQWIRPVGPGHHGEVSKHLRNVKGSEPELLDIIRMTLDEEAETHGFQTENRSIAPVAWEKVGQATVDEIIPYCNQERYIFFSPGNHLPYSQIISDSNKHCSLQLWETHDFRTWHEGAKWDGAKKWKGSFRNLHGSRMTSTIKDPKIEEKLNEDLKCSRHCLILVSLGVPFQPTGWSEQNCWKLIASVIELDK